MAALLLVRYGELALKSPPVRKEFERALRRNVLDQFLRDGLNGRHRTDPAHINVEDATPDPALRILRRVFGVTSVSEVHEVPSEPAANRDRLLDLAGPRLVPGARFAVRARRTGQHPFTSQELARDLGSDVLGRFADRSLSVDLDHPEVELFVEVRGPRTYLSFDRVAGPGGLPLGVAGRLAALVDGPRGALGAFLMMKRGCRVALVTVPSGKPLARETLARFDPAPIIVPAEAGANAWSESLRAEAERFRADGVVLPLSVEMYPEARERWGERVLFSPTVGLSDDEVGERWRNVRNLAG